MTKSNSRARKNPKKRNPQLFGVSAWLAEGMACHQRGDIDSATRLYDRILVSHPNHPDALHLSGLIARRRGDLQQAAQLVQRATDANPGAALYHANLGLILADLDDNKGAISALERALELEPTLATASFNLGIAYEQRGDLLLAIGMYRAATDSELPEASFNLGNVLLALGRPAEAVVAYRRAISLRPAYPSALANLANALQQVGQSDEAIATYREFLKAEPDNIEAKHMVAALSGEKKARPEANYVEQLFDGYAPSFERALVEDLNYQVPDALARQIEAHRPKTGTFARALDIGCGTGLAGRVLRRFCDVLIGVDLSANMVAKADESGGYDELVVGDITQFFRSRAADRFDLIIAADVFIYVGDLLEMFKQVANASAKQGIFAFSIEHNDGTTFTLDETGRFSHSRHYVEEVAMGAGFTVLDCGNQVLRTEQNVPVGGLIYVLRAPN